MIDKYSRPAPRYTSYPTAPLWSDAVGGTEYKQQLEKSGCGSENFSLYVHIPFCASHCLFCGCNSIVCNKAVKISDYLSHLKQEIKLLAPYVKDRKLGLMHWGGGSPSHLNAEQLREVCLTVFEHFQIADDYVGSIEAKPEQISDSMIEVLKEFSFKRISLGIQDFDHEVQIAIARPQSSDTVAQVVQKLRSELLCDSVNFDLIYGLPCQSPTSFSETLEQLFMLSPDRVALFQYAHVPWLKPLQKKLPEDKLPDRYQKMQIFVESINSFENNGYRFIGLDHFAKLDDSLSKAFCDRTMQRNFMGYTEASQIDLYGLGMTSIGEIGGNYFQNTRHLNDYQQLIADRKFAVQKGYLLNDDDRIRKDLIMRIMCQQGFGFDDINKKHKIDFWKYFVNIQEQLEQLISDGFICIDHSSLKVTDLGRLFIRNVCLPFDLYFKNQADKPMFSKSV